MTDKITGWKGFRAGYVCRGHKFEPGEEYSVSGKVELCRNGFHACARAVDVLSYYPVTSEFARVEQWGDVRRDEQKTVSRHIIIEPVRRGEFICAVVADITAHAATTGCAARAATTGKRAHAATTGCDAHAATTGHLAHAATTGERAHAATTGHAAHAATTGGDANAATTGYAAHAATTGCAARAATTGKRAHATTTGYAAHAATTGHLAHAATTGERAHAATTGHHAIACSLGEFGRVKGDALGAVLIAVEYYEGYPRRVASGIVGENGIKPGVWYRAQDGGLVECGE